MDAKLKSQLLAVIKKHPKHYYWKVKKKFPETFDRVVNEFSHLDSFSEKLYQFLNGRALSTCNFDGCEKLCYFRSFKDGYRDYCSQECSHKSQSKKETRICVICSEEFQVKPSKDQKLCSRSCWKKWNRKDSVQQQALKKRRQTFLEKYGKDYFVNPEKAKATKKERYGRENYVNAEKAVETKRTKYGENFEKIFEKVRATKQKRYGNPFYSNIEKIKATNQEKYGESFYFQTELFLENIEGERYNNSEQIRKTTLKNNYNKLCSDSGQFSTIKPLFTLEEYKGVYNNAPVYYKFECLKCNTKFKDSINTGNVPRCPSCFPYYKSQSEQELLNFVRSLFTDENKVLENENNIIESGELDIFIPDKNFAIEFDGLYWHSEKNGRGRKYHLKKTRECEEKNIQLVHVFENEWLFKQSIVKRRLKHLLGKNNQKVVYARKCHIKEIDYQQKNDFLNKHHLQGEDRSSVKLGLFTSSERLVSVMTFSKRRVALGGDPSKNNREYELSRFCSGNYRVLGSAGKLFKHFIRNWDVEKVLSYADRRWTTVNDHTVYDALGFSLAGKTKPNYWYFDNSLNMWHRYNFRKSVLSKKLSIYNPDLTEWENMKTNGYNRIWDCGNLKYKWSQR